MFLDVAGPKGLHARYIPVWGFARTFGCPKPFAPMAAGPGLCRGPHLFEYRLVSRIIGFEFEGLLYLRIGFGNPA
jgi:hypothetical protein